MIETVSVDDDDEHQATLIFLAALLNRIGGEAFVSSEEVADTVMRSAVRFTKEYENEEIVGVRLVTLDQEDAMAIYREMNLDD